MDRVNVRARRAAGILSATLAAGFFAASPAAPFDRQKPKPRKPLLLEQGFSDPVLEVNPSLRTLRGAEVEGFALARAAEAQGLQSLLRDSSPEWEIQWDARGDRPHLIQGAGFPLLPGAGNLMAAAEAGLSDDRKLELGDVERLVRGFLDRYPGLLRVDPQTLRLDPTRSISVGNGRVWFIELAQFHEGVPVEGASVFFRINNGNIVQLGADRIGDVSLKLVPRSEREKAFTRVLRRLGIPRSDLSEIVNEGTLRIHPTLTPGEASGQPFRGRPGAGYAHRLAWEFVFRRGDDPTTYKVAIDAHSGALLQVVDLTRYAEVKGGVYPTTNTDPETVVNFPFATVSNGGTKITDANGSYSYSGGTASATLNGRYFNMNDNCGVISLSNSTTGTLDFGTSGGTDCTTPGTGGAGNTHASRTGFFHLTNINRKAAGFLPGNAWLNSTVTANMNIVDTCNAFWNGSTVNFYRSGGGCSNTGELAAVFLHEWGHGMDENSGGAASEQGSGEAVGDTFAFLETKDSCIGQNFQPGVNCHNCSSCTGVRDVGDFALGGSALIATPANITNNAGPNCDRFACPYLSQGIFPYQGPMGYEGHCESYIASSANWDLAKMLVSAHGESQGWATMDAIWYESLNASKSAYQVASGGKCNPAAVVNGCAASNWYTVYLSVDDDDGNLANGTPNGCRIWDAFNAHGIACGSRPACAGGCTPQPVADAGPDQTITPGASVTIGTPAQPNTTYSWSPGGQTTAQITVSPAVTTSYSVTAANTCGSASDSVTVTVQSGNMAAWDPTLQAPRCATAGAACDSGASLLLGRAGLGPEPNQPNTINDSCADGTSGTFHSDESNDRIKIETVDGSTLAPGKTVRITATVWAWTTPSADRADFYYAANATSPSWTLIGSATPAAAGSQTLTASYTLPAGALQAVRVQFRYQSTNASCAAGAYNDRDDLVFAVASAPDTTPPTTSITSPTDGAIVSGTVNVTASAGDDVGVSRVEFWIDGTLASTDTASPYSYPWVTTGYSNGSSHSIQSRAFDAANNRGDSATITVIVNNAGPVIVFEDSFETDKGWTRNPNGTDTASTGLWERGDPEQTSSSGIKQLGTTVSGVNDLVSARLAGSSAGANDIDGGVTTIQSPPIALPSSGTLTLTFQYYLAHGSNASSADFFRVYAVGGTSTLLLQSLGAATNRDGVWTASGSLSLNAFAGQTIRLRIEAADASTASLVEAGVDDVRITQQ
jgi:hypothetical protein